jgi:amino acid transporter
MATAQPATPAQDNQMKRAVGLRALTMISLGSIIGSGWLLGALNASKVAGAASIISWLLAGAVLSVLALVHAELGSTYPVSGGTARFPYMVFGSLGGFTGGWMAFLQAVTIPPIEVEAAEGFLNSKFPSLNLLHTNGTLTGTGILLGLGFMLVFTIINLVGVRWLAETNSIALIWKLLIPTITIFALIIVVFHSSNFSAGGGFAPYGFHGIFAALPLGVVFAVEGFEQAIQVGGEAENPQKNIPRAVIGSMIIGVIIYLALEVAFVGALNPHDLVHGWSDPIPGVGAFGPYATLATSAGLGWLSTLLIIDAVVSPAATGLVYLGTSSRLSYGLGRNGYYPPGISRISRSGVPVTSIIICFVVGMLCFLPFPSWTGLVGLVTSATVLMYSFAPLSLAGLRKSDPDRVRAYRLPAAKVLCPLSFVLANFIVYFAGWSNVFWLYMLIILGFIIFVIYQASIPAERRTIIDWRSASWLIPWLLGVAAISWQGQYTSDPNTVFGLTLNNTGNLPTWWDLLVLAFWALVIYYWAVAVSMPTDKVQIAVAEVESEAAAAEELTVAG